MRRAAVKGHKNAQQFECFCMFNESFCDFIRSLNEIHLPPRSRTIPDVIEFHLYHSETPLI